MKCEDELNLKEYNFVGFAQICVINLSQNIHVNCQKKGYACKKCEDEMNLKGDLMKHQYLKSQIENEKLLNISTCKEWKKK